MIKFSQRFLNKTTIQSIKGVFFTIFPTFILLLCFFPILVGLFTNYKLVSIRQAGLLLVWIPFLSIPFLYSKKRIFYYLLVILCFINGFVNLGHWILIKAPISASGLFVLFNTNFNEALGFAHLKGSYEYLLILPYLVLLFLAFRYLPKIESKRKNIRNSVVGFIVIIPLIVIIGYSLQGRLLEKGAPTIVKTVLAYKKELKAYKDLKTNLNMHVHQIKASPSYKEKPEVIVLIMGESLNRNHMSLYGSPFETSPLLSMRKDLLVYQDVISGYTHTMTSVPASLTQANMDNNLNPPKSITLAEVFKAAGYKTYWLSNQSPLGIWDNLITLLAQQYDVTNFINTSGNSSHETLIKNSLDSKLFSPLKNTLSQEGSKKFIVLHLIGCHAEYVARYPKEFSHFKDYSSREARTTSYYRNSVLYNDYIVDSLLNIVRNYCSKNGVIGSVVYLSDHGENVFDVGHYAGHDFSGYVPKCIVEIPFIVWLSPEYKRIFPAKSITIKEHRFQPYVSDDLFYSMIDLSGIKTPIFKPERSVFNNQYNNKRKRILEDGKDYDKE